MKPKIIRATTVPESLDTFCKGILQELSEKYEVVGLSSPGAALERVAEREGVRTIAVPMERHISITKDVVSLWRVIKVFHKEKPTMVHSMTPKAGLLCMLAAWITRVPVRVHTFTGLVFPTLTGLKRMVLMATDWLTCACATHIIPEGEGVKNDLINNGITKKTLKVLGYGNVMGVDMEKFSRRPAILDKAKLIRKQIFTFLYVGRIVKDKGINELCKAFDKLSGLAEARLILVGPYEDCLDPISEKSREIIANNPNIESVGGKFGDELLAYYAASDCFVLPSYREGFPNTVLEAGAMGLPSIVTDINGSREIIKQGENGVIIPSQDAEALSDAMINMMKDKSAREWMAGNARKMIADRFDQSFVRKCLYDFYDEKLTPFSSETYDDLQNFNMEL
jgi:glycosyltransferase involved in cell wall biosynthesis